VLEITPVWIDVVTDNSYPLNPYDVNMRFASFEMYTFNGAIIGYLKPNIDIDNFKSVIPQSVLELDTGYYSFGSNYIYLVNATKTEVNVDLRQKTDPDYKISLTYEKYMRFSSTPDFQNWEVEDVFTDEELEFVADNGTSSINGNIVEAVVIKGNDPVETSRVLAGPAWNISWRVQKSPGPVAISQDLWVENFSPSVEFVDVIENMFTTIGSTRIRFLAIDTYGSGSVTRTNANRNIVNISDEDTLVLQRYEQPDFATPDIVLLSEYLHSNSNGYVKTTPVTIPPIFDIGESVYDVLSEVLERKAKLITEDGIEIGIKLKYPKVETLANAYGIGITLIGTASEAYSITQKSPDIIELVFIDAKAVVSILSITDYDLKIPFLKKYFPKLAEFGRISPLITGVIDAVYYMVFEQDFKKATACMIDGALLTYSLGIAAAAEIVSYFVTWAIFGVPMSIGDAIMYIGGWISHFIFGTEPPTLPSHEVGDQPKLHFYEDNWVFIR
jgi:hypothetical protein